MESGIPAVTFETVKAVRLSEINTAADRAISTLTATYPDREIATFDKQESEARAYAADATASTPLLSALAQARGIPLPDLVERVLAKADAFAVASGSPSTSSSIRSSAAGRTKPCPRAVTAGRGTG